MDWKEVGKQLINVGLPVLGTAIAGPTGGFAAKAAASLISAKLGIEEENITPETITNVLADPNQILKLKEAELNHSIRLEELIIEDRKSAREREVGIVKATGTKDWNLYILAWIVVSGFFGLCWLLMKTTLPEGSNEVVFMLFGALATGFGTVLQYFFGSSKSSADKTKLIAEK